MKCFLTFAALFLACSCSKAPEKSQLLTQALYESLVSGNKRIADENTRLLMKIVDALRQDRYAVGQSKQWLADCEIILSQTATVMDSLQKVRLQLRRYAALEKGQNAAEIMLGHDKGGLAYNLLKAINTYSTELRKLERRMKPLALPRANSSQDFNEAVARFYFEDASIAEAFAGLSHIESKILEYETELAYMQAAKGCILDIAFDATGPFAGAKSNVVAAGDTYEAEMALIVAFPEVPLTMTVNEQPIVVHGGRGKVKFIADGKGLEKQDSIKKNWVGTIKAHWRGTDTLWTVKVPYIVVRRRQTPVL